MSREDANCPPDSIFTGGFYDGADVTILLADCEPEDIFKGGINDGAAVFMVSTCDPLPVEMLSLIAYWRGNDGVVQWATATETNNKGFFVERMLTNGDFESLSFVPGAGTSNSPKNYTWIDHNLFNREGKIFYYRLRQVDFDGSENLSEIVSLSKLDITETNDALQILRLYPNPAPQSSDVNLLMHMPEEGNISIQIHDELGRIVYEINMHISDGLHTFVLPVSEWNAGVYQLHIITQSESNSMSLIITK
jgi:hypothetical protein